MKAFLATALLLFTAMLATSAATSAESLRYEPAKVVLTGTVTLQDGFGPPGYGEDPETDMRTQSYVLVLDAPVSVVGDPDDDLNSESVDDVRRVQLVLFAHFRDRDGRRDLAGRHASFEGTLFYKHTGWHVTDVLLTVEKIVLDGDTIDLRAIEKAAYERAAAPRPDRLDAYVRGDPGIGLLHYWPETAVLSGRIQVQRHIGPRNYGGDPNTDFQPRSLVLVLDKPVSVIGDADDEHSNTKTVRNVRRIQLALSPEFGDSRWVLAGRRATFEGTLYHAFSPWHMTEVLLGVEKIYLGDRQIEVPR